MDIRHTTKEFMTEFISIYREHPALWKTKSKEYVNRNLKNVGYDALIELYKKVDPDADRDLVSKKIQSLRGSFRKELKKFEKYRKSGAGLDEQYVPSLWYFDLLMFTRDQELPTDSIDNLSDSQLQSTPELCDGDNIDRMSQPRASDVEVDDPQADQNTSRD
ncbi:hypothetical protein GE061_001442 [Apolygus lucorum]|uniref:MADF domain-containing protein n=1 Tax=Apolygus lucorum TaxID=248454 RepID=A0A8S9Y931_APOLU|nr:hypothetical protein GE061_001442 [Apolygus lucorum]